MSIRVSYLVDLHYLSKFMLSVRATELDLLTEAVNAENYRLHALELQQRYELSLVIVFSLTTI